MKEKIKNMKERLDKFGIIKTLIILVIAFAIFQAGVFVGYGKAMFYRSLGDRYSPFDQRHGRDGGLGKFDSFVKDVNLPGGHGAVGKIVSINLPNIVVASQDNVEKTINISNDTLIRQFRDTIGEKDLKIGDFIIVLGDTSSPDSSIVNAKLIRLLPPPPEDFNNSSISLTPSASTSSSTITSAPGSTSTKIK